MKGRTPIVILLIMFAFEMCSEWVGSGVFNAVEGSSSSGGSYGGFSTGGSHK